MELIGTWHVLIHYTNDNTHNPDQIRHTPPPDPREHVAEMSDAMAELILELLAKDPDARPRRAADVAARLQAIYEAAR